MVASFLVHLDKVNFSRPQRETEGFCKYFLFNVPIQLHFFLDQREKGSENIVIAYRRTQTTTADHHLSYIGEKSHMVDR